MLLGLNQTTTLKPPVHRTFWENLIKNAQQKKSESTRQVRVNSDLTYSRQVIASECSVLHNKNWLTPCCLCTRRTQCTAMCVRMPGCSVGANCNFRPRDRWYIWWVTLICICRHKTMKERKRGFHDSTSCVLLEKWIHLKPDEQVSSTSIFYFLQNRSSAALISCQMLAEEKWYHSHIWALQFDRRQEAARWAEHEDWNNVKASQALFKGTKICF